MKLEVHDDEMMVHNGTDLDSYQGRNRSWERGRRGTADEAGSVLILSIGYIGSKTGIVVEAMGSTVAIKAGREPESLRRLAVSFMGWPIHIVASFLSRMVLRCLALFAVAIRKRPSLRDACHEKVPPVLQQPIVRLMNLHQGEEYFINKRGNVIHIRSYCPGDEDNVKALVLFCHGYGSHCNSPRKHQMGLMMRDQGLCVIEMDLEGHGYSGGERAYIEDYHHWVDDYRQLLELVAGNESETKRRFSMPETHLGVEGEPITLAPHFFNIKPALQQRLREVPIFMSGESLGGAISILLGLSLFETKHPLLPRFKGEVLLAPAIKGNPPPSALVSFLRYFIVPLIPRWQIPSCLESVNRPEMCVLERDERRTITHDVLGYPGGLGWGGNMRFRTGLNLIDLTAEVSNRLHEVKFPFMIMHDPGDGIVRFDSSEELKARASTPESSPRGRELRPMDGWLHCLITNCPELVIQHFQDWVLYQASLCSGDISRGRQLSRKFLSPEDISALGAQRIADDASVGSDPSGTPASGRAWSRGEGGVVVIGSCERAGGAAVSDAESRRTHGDAGFRSHDAAVDHAPLPGMGNRALAEASAALVDPRARVDCTTVAVHGILGGGGRAPAGIVDVAAKTRASRRAVPVASYDDLGGGMSSPVPPPERVPVGKLLARGGGTATVGGNVDQDMGMGVSPAETAAAVPALEAEGDLRVDRPSSVASAAAAAAATAATSPAAASAAVASAIVDKGSNQ